MTHDPHAREARHLAHLRRVLPALSEEEARAMLPKRTEWPFASEEEVERQIEALRAPLFEQE